MLLTLFACSENELHAKEEPVPDTTDTSAPDIVVDPAAIALGDLPSGGEGTGAFTISNVGTATLHLDSLRLSAANSDLSWTSLSTPILPPGDSVEVVVTWTPSGPGALSNTLLVASDDPDEPEAGVELTGGVPYGEIAVAPTAYDFGTLEVGASATTTVMVSNVGDGDLTITDLNWAATDADMVVLDAGDLAALPAVLAPGDHTEIEVQYAPSAAGGDEASLEFLSDDPATPSTGAQLFGEGAEPDPCEGFTQTVDLLLTADDAWEGWIDGVAFTGPNANAWSGFDEFEWEMSCGNHALALYATDTAQVISGVIAVVRVEGTVRFVSGPSDWTMLDTSPPSGWTDPSFDDSSWHIPEVCTNTSPWGSTPQPFYDLGAQWIWWSADCTNLGQAWLRLNFTVP